VAEIVVEERLSALISSSLRCLASGYMLRVILPWFVLVCCVIAADTLFPRWCERRDNVTEKNVSRRGAKRVSMLSATPSYTREYVCAALPNMPRVIQKGESCSSVFYPVRRVEVLLEMFFERAA